MPVTSTIMAVGSWSLNLSPDTPRTLVDLLSSGYFGHVAVATGRHDPRVEGDSLLASARYVGVLTGGTFNSRVSGNGPQLSGDGMATWLATPNSVGDVIESPQNYTAAGFGTVISGLLPSAVHAGTIHSIGTATYTGSFVWTDRRKALTTFCGLMSTGPAATQTVEWRVNGNATLDAGHVSDLYVTNPATAIVARNDGLDMTVRALPGVTQLVEDVKDYTTRVVVLAGGQGASTAVGVANITDVGGSNPYKDLYGNAVKMTRMVSASSVSSANATAAAQTAILPYTLPRDQVRLTSQEYDITGELAVGDYTWVYDPDSGIVDYTQEITIRGQRINPALLRVIELTFPVTTGMTVAYRDLNGNWYDLTDYVIPETGNTTVVVGGYNRALVSTSEPVGARPIPDTTIPGVPAFNTPFVTTSYQSPSDGKTKAQIQLTWTTPTNTDSTTVTDGDHYEIQYRPNLGIFATNPTYNEINAAGYTYNTLAAQGGSYNQLIPTAISDWKVTFVAWGTNQLLVQELTPGVNYDFQIRAADTAAPPNIGAWSATTTFQAAVDTIPPQTPDPPTVAANMASVQVTWDCGSASGGTYNQAVDLNHIEVHGSYDPLFTPSSSTKLGNVQANVGNITGQIPVVASFTIPPGQPPAQSMYIKIVAVDNAGNKSNPSAAAGATAVLWSDAYITDLSVSKLTAGIITASVILGSTLATAATGGRVVMDGAADAFEVYDTTGTQIANWSPSGLVVSTNPGAGTLKIIPNPGTSRSPSLDFTANTVNLTSRPAQIYANTQGSGTSQIEYMLVYSPTNAGDTLASLVRMGLISGNATGLGEGLSTASGILDYFDSTVGVIKTMLTWGSFGVHLTTQDSNNRYHTNQPMLGDNAFMSYTTLSNFSVTWSGGAASFNPNLDFTPFLAMAVGIVGGVATQVVVDSGSLSATNCTVHGWNQSGTAASGSDTISVLFIGY